MSSRTTLAVTVTGCLVALGLTAVSAPAQSAVATCAGVPATIVGTDGADTLTGTPGDDVIAGLDGVDVVNAGAGDDLVCGDAGPDDLVGGLGNDRLYGGTNGMVNVFESGPEPAGDTLAPGPGDDLVDVGVNTVLRADGWNSPDTIDYSASATGVDVDLVSGVATGEGSDTVVVAQPQPEIGYVIELLGSTHSDRLLGTESADQLVGQGGGDWIEGRGGDDLVMNAWDEYSPARGENADDHFDGGAGEDYLDSTGGTDTLLGGEGADHVRKERGPTTVDAGPGRDTIELYLSGGAHVITGGDGRDDISLGVLDSFARTRGVLDHRAEVFRVRHANGRRTRAVIQSVERVQMPHNSGRWTYLGTSGDDRVGGGAAYTARGRGGDDVIVGSYEDDVLLGGPGRDLVRGGRGVDRCRAEEARHCEAR